MLSDRPNQSDTPPQPNNAHADDPIPKVVPPLPRSSPHGRDLPMLRAFKWLGRGWADLMNNPVPSVLYGLGVFAVSALIVWALFQFRYEYALFPALAGFMVVGPLIASGLYEKSRRIEQNQDISFIEMIFVRPASSYQALFMGVMLLGLFLLWLRAAVLIYALFFGLVAFPGTDDLVPMLFGTPTGWALLVTGGAVGALFAAFAFAISVFAIPMLLTERTDALSAMGISMAMVWANLPVMLTWGAIVLALFLIALATGFLGMVVIFPVLGHATWHAYRDVRAQDQQQGESERMFIKPA
tara:strand:- start:25203 stop:26096 length:894 start_codon:yes stop_codon:yes gene_type:complete